MATLADIRTAIQTTLAAALAGVQCYDKVPAKPVPPCVYPVPVDADFAVAMAKGTDTWEFDLVVLVPTADLVVGQTLLDPYVSGAGASSIRHAIWASRTAPGNSLGLTGTDAHVAAMTEYGGTHEYGGNQHIGAVLRLVVHTSGTS
jgi:hypothetical protein